MTTTVETGLGSVFKIKNSSGTLTAIGEPIGAMPIPSGEFDLIEASNFDSVGFKDYIQSKLADGDEADLEMNWTPGSTTDALCRELEGKTRDFEITLPVAAGTWVISGKTLVRKYTRVNPMTDKRTGTLRVKWVGARTEAAGV